MLPISFIGDRFIGTAGRWIDIVAGDEVKVRIWPMPAEWTDVERGLAEELASPGSSNARLIDYARLGTTHWFEARSVDDPTIEFDRALVSSADVERIARRIVAAASFSMREGIRHLRLKATLSTTLRNALSRAARDLRELGYVSLRADAAVPEAIRRQLLHRHLVLFSDGRGDVEPVLAWIRRLTAVSTRSHLVVSIAAPHRRRSPPGVPAGVVVVRERAPAYRPETLAVPRTSSTARDRAASSLRRQRYAAAERWLRAALAAARRRNDEAALVQAAARLTAHLAERDDWQGACAETLACLAELRRSQSRAAVTDLASMSLIATGEFQRAESLLAAIETEAAVRGEALPSVLRVRQAQLRFWQGRFEEAANLLSGRVAETIDVCAWRGLIAWAGTSEAGVAHAVGRLRAMAPARAAAFWIAGLGLLRDALSGDAARVVDAATTIVEDADGIDVFGRRRFARAMAAEALLTVNERDRALQVIDACAQRALESPQQLDQALLAWLRRRCLPRRESGRVDWLDRFVRRSGALGLTRWGAGRAAMNMLHGVSTLLQLVHDADDEQAALKRGCAWVREHAPADAVGFVGRDGTEMIAADGLTRADLDAQDLQRMVTAEGAQIVADQWRALVAMPMRYGGATIGFAIVRGETRAASTLKEAATALASVCAPALRARLDAIAIAGATQTIAPEILGRSPALAAVRESLARAAATTFPVLIEGDSGTGKELVARALHRLSARRDRRFCAVNCAALNDELFEAELFGYARGAFTGAIGARAGLFEEAHGGTLLFDEVSELTPRAQAKLLRAVQEREIRRLGENASRPVDVRIVAATNQSLAAMVGQGRYREDLLFRLSVVRIVMPALRDRLEDVPMLAQSFWHSMIGQTDKRALLGPDALAALCRYPWPGNVRQLQNVVASLVVAAPTRGRITARHVAQAMADHTPSEHVSGVSSDLRLVHARDAFERRMVSAALARNSGRRSRAALELGLSRQGLAKAMKRLGL